MDKELQEIVDEMEFDAEEDKAAFEKLMAGKVGKKIQAGYAKNKDYTTKTQALADAKKQLEAQQEQFNTDQDYVLTQTSAYKTDMEKRLNDALAQVSASTLRGAALETKLRTLAAQYGEDPAELLADVKATREEEKKPAAPTFDDTEFNKRYVPRDEFQGAYGAALTMAPMIRDFERDYESTFGKPYEGSITELIRSTSQEVQQLQSRGQKNVNMFDHLRTKLDFSGQRQRNEEAAKVAAAEERTKWETQTREEIERDVRSKVLAENPNALRAGTQWEREGWRDNLGAAARKNQIPQQTPQDQFQHRQELHRKFEENAAKVEAAA